MIHMHQLNWQKLKGSPTNKGAYFRPKKKMFTISGARKPREIVLVGFYLISSTTILKKGRPKKLLSQNPVSVYRCLWCLVLLLYICLKLLLQIFVNYNFLITFSWSTILITCTPIDNTVSQRSGKERYQSSCPIIP